MARRNADAAAARSSSHLILFDPEICGGSSDLFSFPSQPPDVKNWFSGYEYESPGYSVIPDDHGVFLLSEEDGSETQDPFARSGDRMSKDPTTTADQHLVRSPSFTLNGRSSYSKGSPECRSSPGSNSNVEKEMGWKSSRKIDDVDDTDHHRNSVEGHKQSPERPPPSIECTEQCSHQTNPKRINFEVAHGFPCEEESPPNCNVLEDGFVSTMGNGNMLISRANDEDPAANENPIDEFGAARDGKDYLVSRGDDHSEGSQCSKPCTGTEILRSKLDRKDRARFGDTKRKVEDEISHDNDEDAAISGFVSTKNIEDSREDSMILAPRSFPSMNGVIGRRGDDEQSMSRGFAHREADGSVGYKAQPQPGTRSALADKTNVQVGMAAAAAKESPGKWRCPRKSKPYTGPPLKQLRLEHWVRRAN